MDDGDTSPEELDARTCEESDSVVIRPNSFGTIARAASSAAALALAALITATATVLNMSLVNDIAAAKFYNSRGFNNLAELRWEAGARLIVAGIAMLVALLAGLGYSRDQPAVRFTFLADDEEPIESAEGNEAPGWVRMLVGSAVVVSVLAVLLNAIAFATTLHLHESPNFGLPG